jgi:hypothetical protein
MADVVAAAVPEVPARLVFMGGKATEGRARVVERSSTWRRSQTMKDLALLLLIPLVVFIPPHFPWVLIVLFAAGMRAFNHSREHRTLLSLRGPCPKCGAEQEFRELGRMKQPHAVHCAHCRWELRVDVPLSGAVT